MTTRRTATPEALAPFQEFVGGCGRVEIAGLRAEALEREDATEVAIATLALGDLHMESYEEEELELSVHHSIMKSNKVEYKPSLEVKSTPALVMAAHIVKICRRRADLQYTLPHCFGPSKPLLVALPDLNDRAFHVMKQHIDRLLEEDEFHVIPYYNWTSWLSLPREHNYHLEELHEYYPFIQNAPDKPLIIVARRSALEKKDANGVWISHLRDSSFTKLFEAILLPIVQTSPSGRARIRHRIPYPRRARIGRAKLRNR